MANQKTNYQLTVEHVKKAIKGTKISEVERKTGVTFMEGGDRLCKVVLNKDNDLINLEVNVALPDYKELEYQHISAKEAYDKHLGTMKGRLKTRDINQAYSVINLAVQTFKARKK